VLLGAALDVEFRRQKECHDGYAGEVFINRDAHPLADGEREERKVAGLYRSAQAADGCVELPQERVWLLGYQWPNQGRERSRRADLVGMTEGGGIVVFEAKLANGDSPFIAIAEGLDYLSCLLRPANFTKIEAGFKKWQAARTVAKPLGFEHTVPNREIRPTLVILAPDAYFTGRHTRSIRGRDWPFLASIGESMIPSVRLTFASTNFKSLELLSPSVP
jgi:hypothetical protein